MHRGNPLRRFRRLPQRLAQFVHTGLQHALAHGCLWPDGVEEGLFGHQLTSVHHHIYKDLKGFGAQGDGLLRTPQRRIGLIESERSKVPLHWSSLPCSRPQRFGVKG
jgi:hypothetical protein